MRALPGERPKVLCKKQIVFALANLDPEISYDAAKEERADVAFSPR